MTSSEGLTGLSTTYTDLFTDIRDLYASLPETKAKHLAAKHFSYNVAGGRCEKCQGTGKLLQARFCRGCLFSGYNIYCSKIDSSYISKEGDGSIMTYKTAQIAKLIGVHPNTIRFYEEMKLLPVIPRTESGYRIFNDRHLQQLRLLRTAFRAEIISSKLRQEAFEIVKIAAEDDIDRAYLGTQKYLEHLRKEKAGAEEAIRITLDIIEKSSTQDENIVLTGRNETAAILGVTTDVLRNWERNGLIQVPQNAKGCKKYGTKELNRLKIIRTLRNAHYSIMSILRMLNRLDNGEMDIREAINTPGEDEDIVCAADRYITALSIAEKDALKMIDIIDAIRK